MDSQNEVNNPVKTFFRLHKIAFSHIFSLIKQHQSQKELTQPPENSFSYSSNDYFNIKEEIKNAKI